jgi:integrase
MNAIKRSEVMRLMNKIESRNGPRMADMIYSHIAQVMQWWESQSDDFAIPLPRKGRSTGTKSRKRILTDNELRNIWTTAQQNGDPFAKLVQFLLLTGARLQEAAQMTRDEVRGDIWTLPARRNFKTKQDVRRPLSQTARDLLDSLPVIGASDFYFSQSGTPLGNIGDRKKRIAQASGADKPPPEGKIDERFAGDWRLHDLRRTAKSLLSRAGVNPLVSEKCLGHVLPGIQKTYDQYDYLLEMRAAYERLATLIDGIVRPQDNVRQLRG